MTVLAFGSTVIQPGPEISPRLVTREDLGVALRRDMTEEHAAEVRDLERRGPARQQRPVGGGTWDWRSKAPMSQPGT